MKLYFALSLIIFSFIVSAQMDNTRIQEILTKQADTITGITGKWKFSYKDVLMFCVTDEINNRMRIISPITETNNLDKELLLDALTANFHSALDVKYAISNDILWSVFIHPLKELQDHQLENVITQVYNANITFGTTFSSTELLFGAGGLIDQKKENKKEVLQKEKSHKLSLIHI